MNEMAVRILKRKLPDSAFAPTFCLRKRSDEPLMLVPSLRWFALLKGYGQETIESFIAAFRHNLDPHNSSTRERATLQPIEDGTIAEQFARLLTLAPHPIAEVRETARVSERANLSSLMRVLVGGTMPLKTIAGATGMMKADLKFAVGEAKAACITRHADGDTPIEHTEIYPAIGDLAPRLYKRRIRLPFCAL